MGFYVRKGFNFGPLRLNLSRSGLGASIGVKGARIGVGPRGTYVHLGRGGLYYRQTIAPPDGRSFQEAVPHVEDGLHDISSSAAENIIDGSALQLLQELNRIKRRFDLFPLAIIAGGIFLMGIVVLRTDLLTWVAGLFAVGAILICARHNDVSDGTLILQYSIDGTAWNKFLRLQNAFKRLSGCQRIWHVDAGAETADWKRNAGASFLQRRSATSVLFALPPRVQCNINVPNIKAGQRTLYLLPDRVLVYDSSGVGAVSYSDLQAHSGVTRFIENEKVPNDSTQVGITWRYVAKNGGPDRRFSNNRPLPVMLYGEINLASSSGLNERFQFSVPEAATELSSALAPSAHYESGRIDVSFASQGQRRAFTRVALWTSFVVMVGCVSIPLASDKATELDQQAFEVRQGQDARQQLARGLEQNFINRKVTNVLVGVSGAQLQVNILNESPKAARRDGVRPLDRKLVFTKLLRPDTEANLCAFGFHTIRVTVNAGTSGELALACQHAAEPTSNQ